MFDEIEDSEDKEIEEAKGDDVYSSEMREDMLESDGISPEEQAFMDGYDAA